MKRAATLPVVVPCLAIAVLAMFMVPRTGMSQPALEGSRVPDKLAPRFLLADQWGRKITLTEFRGRPIVLTFLEAHCREQCPLVAEKLRMASANLDRAGRPVVVLVVSTDPAGDSRGAVRAFSRAHGMLHRWHYLTGSRRDLTPVWEAYHVFAAPTQSPPKLRDMHTSATYLIDTAGRQRVLLGGDPDLSTLVRDLRILAGLPVTLEGNAASAPVVGRPAPNFSLRDPGGKWVSLRSLRGKVVLVNFWATWCHPCRSEIPRLSDWYRQLHDRRFVVLGVDKQEGGAEVQRFVHTLHVPYRTVLDSDGLAASRYDLLGLPATFLVDRQGIVRSVHQGALDPTYLRTELQPLVHSSSQR